MDNVATSETSVVDAGINGRVLVFSVDDGLFGIHLDWAEAVYPKDAGRLHHMRVRGAGTRSFLNHGGRPALVFDLRELLGLGELLGQTPRTSFVVVRSGSHLLAVGIDALVGVQEMDFGAQGPMPSALRRESGLCVAHLVEHETGILAILDPNRLLDSRTRENLDPLARRAAGFLDREARIGVLEESLRVAPSVGDLRAYARLCRRNARSGRAGAAHTLLRHLEGGAPVQAESPTDRALAEIVRCLVADRSGQLIFDPAEGFPGARISICRGCITSVTCAEQEGREALAALFLSGGSSTRFREMPFESESGGGGESAVTVLLDALEVGNQQRRRRRRS